MEELTQRTQQVVESLTGNEALTDHLDDAAAQELLDWGIATGKAVVQSTADLTEEVADATMQPRLQATRRLLRTVNRYFAATDAPTARAVIQPDHEALLTLVQQTTEQAAVIWGSRFRQPDDQQLAAVAAQLQKEASTPQALIAGLRRFVDQQVTAGPVTSVPPDPPTADQTQLTTTQPVVAQTPWMKRLLEQLRRFYPQQQQ
ncbi:MAG: hypothetical protein R3E79_14205 [Caldilineaceae bacterium]